MAAQPCFAVSKKRRTNPSEEIHFEDLATMDAQTYLGRVVEQANRLPEFFTATQSSSSSSSSSNQSLSKSRPAVSNPTLVLSSSLSSAASLAYLLSPSACLTPPPNPHVLPASPREWVDACCADFEQLRVYLQKIKAHIGKERRFPHALPLLKDRAGWHVFCLGQAEACGNAGNYFDDDDDDDENSDNDDIDDDENDDSDVDTNTKNNIRENDKDAKEDALTTTLDKHEELTTEKEAWRQHLPPTGYPPQASLLLQMDQVMVRRILSHFVFYSTEGWPMTANRAAWCYALLARLETPLHREQAVLLYDWLKALTVQRAKGRPSETLASLNILITLVAIYLEQGGGFNATMVPTNTCNNTSR